MKVHHSIVNDVLIALSARSIGATVVTQNGAHYRAIQSVARSSWMSCPESTVEEVADGAGRA